MYSSQLVRPYNMLEIMGKTLSYVEPRLVDHGKRVAYLTFKMLKALNKHNESEMRDICIAALLHDIGAYKTEEIEKLVAEDASGAWEHSIYSYLFIKYFSPIKEMATPILFHHTRYDKLATMEPNEDVRLIAQILHLADRLDILAQANMSTEKLTRYLEHTKGAFDPILIEIFIGLKIEPPFDIDDEYIELMQGLSLTDAQVLDYLKMTVYSIDYRSRHTVNHTIGTTTVAELLARYANLDDITIEQIKAGALIHDLGKAGVPLEILESTGRLSPEEMAIMRTHIDMTYEILEGNISDEIMHIAARHHEKLNGEGYAKGLTAAELTVPERIMAVADVFSALYGVRSYKKSMSPDEIKGILLSMRDNKHLDGQIVQLAVNNCDNIMHEIDNVSAPLLAAYDNMQNEYTELRGRYVLA